MKRKIIYLLLTSLLFIEVTACKKNYDYTCKCKFPDGTVFMGNYYSNMTKDEAENKCASQEQEIHKLDSVAQTVTCNLE